jgi:hypothetical protein
MFSGDISKFRGGDLIQLAASSDTPTSVTYPQRYHVLAVRHVSDDLVAKVRLDKNDQSDALALTNDGKRNFDISLAGSTASSVGGAANLSVRQRGDPSDNIADELQIEDIYLVTGAKPHGGQDSLVARLRAERFLNCSALGVSAFLE